MRPKTAASDTRPVALRSLALPVEHGGWGLLAEPVLLGLVLAPSWAGVGIGLAALLAFLARHPLKLALADLRRGARYPRTRWAVRFAGLYAAGAFLGLGLAFAVSLSPFWPPLALAAPLGLLQLVHDVRGGGRALLPELAGAAALSVTAAAIALAGGWPLLPALIVALLLSLRAVESVLYVRARLRLDRGLPPDVGLAWASHLAGITLVGLLAWIGWAPWLAVVAFAVLLARAAHGLSRVRRVVRPQIVGVQEMGFGFLTALLVAAGYSLGI